MMFSLGLIFLITGTLGAKEGDDSVSTLTTPPDSATAASEIAPAAPDQHRKDSVNYFFTIEGMQDCFINPFDYDANQDYGVVRVTTRVNGKPLTHRLKPLGRPGDSGALPPPRQNDGAPIYVQYHPKPQACGYRMEMKRWQLRNNTYWGLVKKFQLFPDKKVDIAYVVDDPERHRIPYPPDAAELVLPNPNAQASAPQGNSIKWANRKAEGNVAYAAGVLELHKASLKKIWKLSNSDYDRICVMIDTGEEPDSGEPLHTEYWELHKVYERVKKFVWKLFKGRTGTPLSQAGITIKVERKATTVDSISEVFDHRNYYSNERVISNIEPKGILESFNSLSVSVSPVSKTAPVQREPVESSSDSSEAEPPLAAMEVDEGDKPESSEARRPKRKRVATPRDRLEKKRRIDCSNYSKTGGK